MAYQNVGTPRFYIDSLNWIRSLGLTSSATGVFNFNPSSQTPYINHSSWKIYINGINLGKLNFIAMLGHNSGGQEWQVQSIGSEGTHYWSCGGAGSCFFTSSTLEVNYGSNPNQQLDPIYNGFTIGGLNVGEGDLGELQSIMLYSATAPEPTVYLGCLLMGHTYEMPHSPDLNLTMSREYGGTKTIETKGGASLSNTTWTKPPMWGSAAPWELYQGTATNQKLSRSGRKTWDLSFSYLQDSDVFGSNQSLGISINDASTGWQAYLPPANNPSSFESSDIDSNTNYFNYNLLTDDNFFSQVIHKTNGGQLPFIFQPDSSNSNPDQFAICKFDMNSFKFDQVANGVYNVKLKIREVW